MGMMKALVCTEPRHFEYKTLPVPTLTKDHAIIKVKRIGICGTDLHAFEGTQPFLSYPRILGHELSGELVAADNAPGFSPKEIVSFIPYFNCGNCIACRSGKPNCCVRLQVCGVHVDGGMTEYISVPSDLLLHSDGLSLDEMALIEPLAIGAHGIRRAGVTPGEFVVVIGAGPIGLGAMEFAMIAGGKVIAIDINQHRLQFCKAKLNVPHTINALSSDVTRQLKEVTDGDMPTVVIDATGNLSAINNGFKFMAHGARYVLIGLQRGELSISHPEFHKREGTLMSSRNATREDFDHVIAALKNKRIDPATYITHRAEFDDVIPNFERWLNPESNVIKAMIQL